MVMGDWCCGLMVELLGLRVQGIRFGIRVRGLGFSAQCSREMARGFLIWVWESIKVQGSAVPRARERSRIRVHCSVFRGSLSQFFKRIGIPGLGFRVLGASLQTYLTESAHKVVLQKSIPAQIRQLILYIYDDEGQVDGFVREPTFAKQLYKFFL